MAPPDLEKVVSRHACAETSESPQERDARPRTFEDGNSSRDQMKVRHQEIEKVARTVIDQS